ncbi:TetR family transcriptional regulator [Mucilaginibacter gracilis]|uniref:TetR family transcriptional regulator n=1 Tax=Mucilaginibacter gracilis TaxID=423350 RepID=A0A495J046_9SPHI|nr:TetR/AcrR family transcriptional regulator [Mucilaginibacter gracilis]RKR82102.1 TetR family transcriptional regulator [Mucilaginibacter gracilis]
MVTRKKTLKLKDGEETQRELIAAVGDTLREEGFQGLKTNRIAKRIGKDKNVVRYHFENMEGLQKAYIREKDHWLPFFEKFKLGDNPGRTQVQQLFRELMQANFSGFLENPEMQQIILWQISEANPLLTGISEEREREGARLLEKTDPFFGGSGVNFRAVVSLLLGGIYYIVLHAKTNKSTVSGMDANKKSDRAELHRTIGQILDWAWQASEQQHNK